LTGEDGPYKDIKLLDDVSDPSRNRALLAFASPKHERLFSLLDRREFDQIEIITPKGDAPHAKVATYAAEFICQNCQSARKFFQVSASKSFQLSGLSQGA
jgi:hypothetical protein